MEEHELPDVPDYREHLKSVRAAWDGALNAAGADVAVIFAGGLRMAFLDDRPYPFVVNPQFAWWLPLTEAPDCYVIYKQGDAPILCYCQPDDYWHAVPSAPDPYWADAFDVRPTKTGADAREHLPPGMRAPIFIGEVNDPAQALGIERQNPSAALHWLDDARIRKTHYEIQHMRAASLLGARAHTATAASFHAGGASEYDLHTTYLASISALDEDLPYHSIVGLNEHAAILHYQFRDRVAPAQQRSFLIDAGAQSAGYASDITRTYSNGSGLFEDLIGAMDVLQQGICADVKAGVDYTWLHQSTHERLARVLVDSGICRGASEALVDAGVTRTFFPHGLGHYLGLQVHDVGGHQLDASGAHTVRPESDPHLRLTRGLGANEVLTIEPGLYFIDLLLEPLRAGPHADLVDWSVVEALKPFGGIRIEDNVRVTETGNENLTRDAFLKVSTAEA